MIFNVREKLAGIIPLPQNQIAALEADQRRAQSLHNIINNDNWPVIQQLFDKYYAECVNILGKNDLPEKEWRRINCRVELLSDIRRDIQEGLACGEAATIRLQKLKEKENGGRTY